MKRELYFDISSAQSGGSLFRVTESGAPFFYYNHSTYDEDKDDLQVFETRFASFEAFWQHITKDPAWFYLHPLYVHPEQREYIRQQLQPVNWNIHPDKKWQDSHQRQWKKVLNDPAGYYAAG